MLHIHDAGVLARAVHDDLHPLIDATEEVCAAGFSFFRNDVVFPKRLEENSHFRMFRAGVYPANGLTDERVASKSTVGERKEDDADHEEDQKKPTQAFR
jgi:hypothetical protein